jgi:CBS domain-containing protein
MSSRIPVLTPNTTHQNTFSNTYDGSNMSQTSYRSPTPSSNDAFDTRKRQSRRDEAIRKKIESQLNLKAGKPQTPRGGAGRRGATNRKQVIAGTVSALRPLPALTVPQGISVADASQLCAAKRTDCVLVVDDEEHLAGIFTAKDLAFRVVAGGMDARITPVSAIMTRSPMVTRDTTSATEALNTMVTRGFRHLPVCNEEGDVVGLLDIAKVFYEALEKLERAHGSSQKLYNALEGVQTEWGGGAAGPQNAMLAYVESLRQKMSIPDLSTILDSRTLPCTVGVRTTVCDAAKVMKEHHTTAVCVMEGGSQTTPPRIAGIFTSKDVVLRVIAAGLDPKTCSVVRVMTPHPDTAPPTMSIQEALRKMHDGRYLNLPVIDVDARLVGVVDVLKLTYATLEQINSMSEGGGANGEEGENGGPMWNRFWNSFGQTAGSIGGNGTADDGESAMSGSHAQHMTPDANSKSHLPDLSSDLHPNDSASAVANNHDDNASGVGLPNGAGFNPNAVVDDGTYLFKFVTPSGRTHRFSARYDNFETIREIVCIKLAGDPFFDTPAPLPANPPHNPEEPGHDSVDAPSYAQIAAQPPASAPDPNDFSLAYTDDEDDVVLITEDGDVKDSVQVARKHGKDRVVLLLQSGKTWLEAQQRLNVNNNDRTARKKARESLDAQLQSVKEEEEREGAEQAAQKIDEEDEEEEGQRKTKSRAVKKSSKKSTASDDDDLLFGVLPKEMALPAAVGFLGVAILAAVALTRSSSK